MKKHKNIVIFLTKFFVTYAILFVIYATYLQNSQEKENEFKTASITTLVAKQTVSFFLCISGLHMTPTKDYTYMYMNVYILYIYGGMRRPTRHVRPYLYMYISGHIGGQGLRAPNGAISRNRGDLFDFCGLFMEKTAWSSASCDRPSWAGSNTAIESFWRCLFVKI